MRTEPSPERHLPAGVAPTASELAASGALGSLFKQSAAGELQLSGTGGLTPELIKAALERSLQAEFTSHLGYENGDRAADLFENHRNVPRDLHGDFIPRLGPRVNGLGGLDDMIISLYAGSMTIRDIQHHLASTIGT